MLGCEADYLGGRGGSDGGGSGPQLRLEQQHRFLSTGESREEPHRSLKTHDHEPSSHVTWTFARFLVPFGCRLPDLTAHISFIPAWLTLFYALQPVHGTMALLAN